MQDSTFTNATGFSDPNLRVTVRDMAQLARHIMQAYPDMYPYFAERDFTWDKIHQENRNPLLGMGIGADGLKTGETAEAGFNLVGSAVVDDLRLIVVVTGAKTDNERSNEAKKLLDFGFHGFEAKILFAEGQTIGDAKVFGGDRSYVPLVAPAGTIRMMVPRNANERLLAKVVYTGPVPAPITKGQTDRTAQSVARRRPRAGTAADRRRRCRHRHHVAAGDGWRHRTDDRTAARRGE